MLSPFQPSAEKGIKLRYSQIGQFLLPIDVPANQPEGTAPGVLFCPEKFVRNDFPNWPSR